MSKLFSCCTERGKSEKIYDVTGVTSEEYVTPKDESFKESKKKAEKSKTIIILDSDAFDSQALTKKQKISEHFKLIWLKNMAIEILKTQDKAKIIAVIDELLLQKQQELGIAHLSSQETIEVVGETDHDDPL